MPLLSGGQVLSEEGKKITLLSVIVAVTFGEPLISEIYGSL